MRRGAWIQTFSGIQFWPLDPRPEEILIEDIAHGLSLQCRFAGHTKKFYSTAQHSVLVSHAVPCEDAPWGLLHDSPETYLNDMASPIKHSSILGQEYCCVEDEIMACGCRRFGLPRQEPKSVRLADDVLLVTEQRDLMGKPPTAWSIKAKPLPYIIDPWDGPLAERVFLARYKELFPND